MTTDVGAPDDVLERIQKLLNLAAHNPNENEAALALEKAQAMLAEWNLDASAVSEAKVGGGAREKTALDGGFWEYEQNLWSSVARLNFCLWWHQRVVRRGGRTMRKDYWTGEKRRRTWGYDHRHSLVGRKVNVAATVAMAGYLQEVVKRLAADRVRGSSDLPLYGRWANSYRLGVVRRICEKIEDRRTEVLAEEKRKKRAAERAATGASTSTALSLQVYVDAETDANYDFLYGEGWSARRAAVAAERRREREEYVRWAAANPEEAREREEEAQKERRRRGGVGSRGGSGERPRRDDTDWGAYYAGYDDAAGVSIDPQATGSRPAGLL